MMTFEPEEAIQFAQEGRLEEWIHLFLTASGQNTELSVGLKRQRRWWLGPQELPLALLQRCAGPEPTMEYWEPAESFERRIKGMADALRTGWLPPPLIIEYRNEALIVRDGTHRYEALRRSVAMNYWSIVWFNSAEDYHIFVE